MSAPAPRNFATAQREAQTGDRQAQYELGLAYESGGEVEPDSGMALNWFSRAAEQWHAEALWKVGQAYLEEELEIPTASGSAPPRIVQHPEVIQLALTDNGLALSASKTDELRIWDIATGELQAQFEVSPPIALSADGLRLAGFTTSGNLGLWQIPSGQLLQQTQMNGCFQLHLNDDGSRAVLYSDGAVRVWEPDRQRLLPPLQLSRTWKVYLYGSYIALNCGNTLTLFDPSTGQYELPALCIFLGKVSQHPRLMAYWRSWSI